VRKLNLFKKIFVKHLHAGVNPAILADDVGALHGIVGLQRHNAITGKLEFQGEYKNLIVNQSKSSIIRLLAQGQSQYKGIIDPSKFRISKMRFSNDTGIPTNGALNHRGLSAPNKLDYYNMSEISSRVSWAKMHAASGAIAGGGDFTKLCCPADYNEEQPETNQYLAKQDIPNTGSSGGWIPANVPGGKIVEVQSAFSASNPLAAMNVRPPSHGTLNVKFFKNNFCIEEHFYDKKPESQVPDSAIYTKDAFNNRPHTIKNYKKDEFFYHVCMPMSESASISHNTGLTERITEITQTGPNTTGTRLFFDYTAEKQGWKLFLQEIVPGTPIPSKYSMVVQTRLASGEEPNSSNHTWDRMEISYEIGKHNVVNLIIPKTGYNFGTGINSVGRYGNQDGDAYQVLNPYYYDCPNNFVDDYAVMFTTSMGPQQGNGNGGSDKPILQYTKAFLFTENDDMFSSIQFLGDDFLKNENSTYTISWKILAPVE